MSGPTDTRSRRDRIRLMTGRAPAPDDVEVVLDALPQPAFVVAIGDDEVCRFVHANARYRALFGLDLENGLGDDLRSVLPADVLVAHINAFARASVEAESVSFEVALENGRRTLSIDVVLMPEGWGQGHCVLGVVHDVTEYKRIEALLAHRVRHDPLTELPNRVMLIEQLADSIAAHTVAHDAAFGRARAARPRPLQDRQ